MRAEFRDQVRAVLHLRDSAPGWRRSATVGAFT